MRTERPVLAEQGRRHEQEREQDAGPQRAAMRGRDAALMSCSCRTGPAAAAAGPAISRPKLNMLLSEGCSSRPATASLTPISRPPISAPVMLPSPPTITMTKASSVYSAARNGCHRDDGDHQRTSRADAGRADAEGDGIEAAHVEADDQRAHMVVGGGADRLAGARAGEEQPEQARDDDGGDGRVQAHGVEHQRPQLVGIELRVELHAARIGTDDGEAGIDQQDARPPAAAGTAGARAGR